jgi:hypothetical protein
MPRKPAVVRAQGMGKRLRQAMLDAELQPADLIQKSGLSKHTVYRALSADEATRETATTLEATLGLSAGVLLARQDGEVSGGSAATAEADSRQAAPSAERVAKGLPYEIRVWLQAFLLEITKAGATEEEVDEARQLLTAPEVSTYWSGGNPREFSEADVLETMEAIADGVIRPGLRRRGRKL